MSEGLNVLDKIAPFRVGMFNGSLSSLVQRKQRSVNAIYIIEEAVSIFTHTVVDLARSKTFYIYIYTGESHCFLYIYFTIIVIKLLCIHSFLYFINIYALLCWHLLFTYSKRVWKLVRNYNNIALKSCWFLFRLTIIIYYISVNVHI